LEIVVDIRRGECRSFCYVAHPRFYKSTRPELPPGGAQNLEAPRQVSPVLPAVTTLGLMI
jgi:hypothetical protein